MSEVYRFVYCFAYCLGIVCMCELVFRGLWWVPFADMNIFFGCGLALQ